jgi:hypothetical protein
MQPTLKWSRIWKVASVYIAAMTMSLLGGGFPDVALVCGEHAAQCMDDEEAHQKQVQIDLGVGSSYMSCVHYVRVDEVDRE